MIMVVCLINTQFAVAFLVAENARKFSVPMLCDPPGINDSLAADSRAWNRETCVRHLESQD